MAIGANVSLTKSNLMATPEFNRTETWHNSPPGWTVNGLSRNVIYRSPVAVNIPGTQREDSKCVRETGRCSGWVHSAKVKAKVCECPRSVLSPED